MPAGAYIHIFTYAHAYETTKCNNQETKATNWKLAELFVAFGLSFFFSIVIIIIVPPYRVNGIEYQQQQQHQKQKELASILVQSFHREREQGYDKIGYEWKLWCVYFYESCLCCVLFRFLLPFNLNDIFMHTAHYSQCLNCEQILGILFARLLPVKNMNKKK